MEGRNRVAEWRIRRCLAIVARLHRTHGISSKRRRLTVRELLLNELEDTLLRMASGGTGTVEKRRTRTPANDR